MGISKAPDRPARLLRRRRLPLHNKRYFRTVQRKTIELPSATTSRPGSKRVRFSANQQEQRAPDTDPLDKNTLWWSKNERSSIQKRSLKAARTFKRTNSERVVNYLEVFSQCSQDPSESSSDYLEQATLQVPDHVRGLEYAFVPSIKARRKTHSRQVMDTQEEFQNLPEERKLQFLASRAIKSSRPSRLLARLVGDSDAAIAQD